MRWAFVNEIHNNTLIILAHDHMQTDVENELYHGITRAIQLTTDYNEWEGGVMLNHDQFQWGYDHYVAKRQYIENLEGLGKLSIVSDIEDLETCCDNRTPKVILSFEGVYPFEGDISKFDEFYSNGLRQLQLRRQSNPQTIRSFNTINFNSLSQFGQDLIEQCNLKGVAIDISHIESENNSDEIINEILTLSTDPVLFSHRNPRGENNSLGGLISHDIVSSVVNDGGIVCLNFLQRADYVLSQEQLILQIKYFRDNGWMDHVGLGGDYFPQDAASFVIQDVTKLSELTYKLHDEGFSSEEIKKLYGINLMNYYRDIWDN